VGTFVEAAKAGEFQDGTMKEVEIQGKRILLARIKGKYYATQGRCPHFGGNLSHGVLDGTVVTCPLHGSRFDLTDGHVVAWVGRPGVVSTITRGLKSPRSLDTYKVKIEGDKILVEV
jgi:3-phenylpropionate/trans-cinnamate dioxygenase ferredoxin subunit